MQFYIASNSACKEMIKHMFPIDVQVDAYLSNLKTLGYINLYGYNIYGQKFHNSFIQDICLLCYFDGKTFLYYTLIMIIIIVILLLLWMTCFRKKCKI